MDYIVAAFVIGLVILAHELGHFIASKAVNIPVRTFSIGFGPKLWGFKKGKTEYRIALIPFGGYIMPDIEDEKDLFAFPVWRRIVLTAGGPLASIVLPVFCCMLLNVVRSGVTVEAVLVKPLVQTMMLFSQILQMIPHLFTRHGELSGILGIISQGGQFIGANPLNIIQFAALISINLAVLNLLPIPVLDGGKIMLYLCEKLTPRLRKLHFPLAVAGWVFILVVMIYATALDVGRYVEKMV